MSSFEYYFEILPQTVGLGSFISPLNDDIANGLQQLEEDHRIP
jgi:hypothetical protein